MHTSKMLCALTDIAFCVAALPNNFVHEIILPKNLVHQGTYTMYIIISDLYKNGS